MNVPLFSRACKEWEFMRHTIDVEIKGKEKMICPACGGNPVMGSSDGNVKCHRRACAGAVRKKTNKIERFVNYFYY